MEKSPKFQPSNSRLLCSELQARHIVIVAAVETAGEEYCVIMLWVEDFNRARFVVMLFVVAERDD